MMGAVRERNPTVALTCSLLLILWACQALRPEGQHTGEMVRLSPLRVFDHEAHGNALGPDAFRCESCHLQELGQTSEELSLAGRDSCHDCHVVNLQTGKGRLKCRDCHLDLQRIKPMDHISDWGATHGTNVSSSRVACSECHTAQFCTHCHHK